MKPYYQDKWVTIYHGDCREVLPQLDVKVDLVLTDPPYPNSKLYGDSDITFLKSLPCRQLIFWTPYCQFPLDYTAIHIWDKMNGGISQYEQIYERNGMKRYKCFRHYLINSTVAASYCRDVFTGHPSQKPWQLIQKLLVEFGGNLILDPFLGSGTTCFCAKKLNRYSIGIEIEEKYCEIAARRCSQEVMELHE